MSEIIDFQLQRDVRDLPEYPGPEALNAGADLIEGWLERVVEASTARPDAFDWKSNEVAVIAGFLRKTAAEIYGDAAGKPTL